MKKKGILLIGSLSLMVVAMVFIAVTLISRSTVTPETSDAATLKKRKVIQSKRVKTDKQIFSAVARSPKLTYYLHLLVGGTWVYED